MSGLERLVSLVTHPATRVLADTAKFVFQHPLTQEFLRGEPPTADRVNQAASEYAMPPEAPDVVDAEFKEIPK